MDIRELLLLGCVQLQDMHGYQLIKFLDERVDFLVDLKPATIYSLLDRLEEKGYIASEVGREGNRPERRVYRITAEGDTRFMSLLGESVRNFVPARYPDEVGLYFMDRVPDSDLRIALGAKLEQIRVRVAEFRERADRHADTPAHWLFEHHLAHLEVEHSWLKETVDRLEISLGQPAMSGGQNGSSG